MENKVNQIFIKHLNMDFLRNTELINKHFFSKEINAPIREVVLALLDIEKEFGRIFSDEFLHNEGFKSFETVIDYMRLNL